MRKYNSLFTYYSGVTMKRFFTILLFTISILSFIQAQVPTDSLVAYYPFNGNANDESGNGNNGTNMGAVSDTDRFGNLNNSFYFDGNSSIIANIANLPLGSQSRTISAWINIDPNSVTDGYVAGWGNFNVSSSWYLNIYNDQYRLVFWNTDLHTSTNVTKSQWIHYLASYDGSIAKIYINGIIIDTKTIVLSTSLTSLGIGSQGFSTYEGKFKGSIDDVRIYNRTLNGAEIQALYNEGGYDPSLVAYYPFNNDPNDESGNGLNGINNGATTTTDRLGNPSSAYSFDGMSSYIEILDPNGDLNFDVNTQSYSVSVWVKMSTLSHNQTFIVDRGDGDEPTSYTLQYRASEQKFLADMWNIPGDCPLWSATLPSANIWYQLTMVVNNNILYLYVNGNIGDQKNLCSSILATENSLHKINIGRMMSQNTDYTEGKLDDIRIYNRALSSDEIEQLYGNYRQRISAVTDIPNDKGGKVRIKWDKIYLDSTGTTPQITAYGVWRKVPTGLAVSKHVPNTMAIMNDTLGLWYDYLGTVMATQSPSYNFVAQTLYDSSSLGSNDEQYLITAHTSDPSVYFISEIGSGHSVDNSTQVIVSEKWNLVSVPRLVQNYSKSVLFPTATSDAFAFDGGYIVTPTLSTGTAYWLKFNESQKITFFGYALDNEIIQVNAGWNMIGSNSSTIDTTSITSDPGGIVTSSFFGYDNGYFITDTIGSGKGYWVKVNQAGTLILSSSTTMSAVNRITIVPTNELPPSPPDGETNSNNSIIPSEFSLAQNYPNPFNPVTVISYQLPVNSFVTLKVFNSLGQEVAMLVNQMQDAGYKTAEFDANHLPSGIYYYRISAGNPSSGSGQAFSNVKKMLLAK